MEENHEVMWILRKSPDVVVCMGEQLGKRDNITDNIIFYTHTISYKELQTFLAISKCLKFYIFANLQYT
jgi:hypothetical protein